MKSCKLKLNKLALATSLAVAALSGQAMAAAPTDPLTPTPDINVYLSGASAPQNILGALAATLFGSNVGCPVTVPVNNFCNYHVYYSTGTSTGADYRAYYGALSSAQTINGRTLSAGTKVLLTHRAKGGSVHGVNPVALHFPIAHMPISASCTFVSGSTNAWNHTCAESGTDNVSGRIPDFGVSDVAPNMFKADFNKEPGIPVNFNQLSATQVGYLDSKAVFALMFGVPATAAVPTSFTVNGVTTPPGSFTKAMYAAMLTNGGIADWNQIQSTASPLTGNTGVVVCRRVQGSGTQATYNAYFNNWPCTVSSIIPGSNTTPARMENSYGASAYTPGGIETITVDPTAGYTVIENSGSGNVRTCLNYAQGVSVSGVRQDLAFVWNDDAYNPSGSSTTVNVMVNGVSTPFNLRPGQHVVVVQFSNSTNPFRAIGVLSNDSRENTDGAGVVNASTLWTFRGLNTVPGVVFDVVAGYNVANKAAMRTGDWDFAAEVTMQYLRAGTTTGLGYINAAGAYVNAAVPASGVERNRRDFLDLFIQRAGDPDILNQISSLSTRAAAVALPGTLANYNPKVNANVSFVTRAGNLCAPNQWLP